MDEFAASVPVTVWLWFAGLLLQSVAFGVLGTWWVSTLIAAIRDEIAHERKEVDQSIADVENELRDRQERSERLIGETVAAVRQKIHEVEVFIRDTYVRRDSFLKTSEEVRESLKDFGDRIEKRIDIMDKKLDRLQSRGPQ
jgi:septal ring factor EnvC (AmiA/AmiB activator)